MISSDYDGHNRTSLLLVPVPGENEWVNRYLTSTHDEVIEIEPRHDAACDTMNASRKRNVDDSFIEDENNVTLSEMEIIAASSSSAEHLSLLVEIQESSHA